MGSVRDAAETTNTICIYPSTLSDERAIRRDANELPSIDANIKVAKMKPWGISSSFGLKAGVQRNTKVYIEPSNSDCIAPNNAIFSSDKNNHSLKYQVERYVFHFTMLNTHELVKILDGWTKTDT